MFLVSVTAAREMLLDVTSYWAVGTRSAPAPPAGERMGFSRHMLARPAVRVRRYVVLGRPLLHAPKSLLGTNDLRVYYAPTCVHACTAPSSIDDEAPTGGRVGLGIRLVLINRFG